MWRWSFGLIVVHEQLLYNVEEYNLMCIIYYVSSEHFINIITTRFSIVIRIIVLQPTSRIRVTFRLKVSVKLKGRSLGPTWYVTTDHISASNIGSSDSFKPLYRFFVNIIATSLFCLSWICPPTAKERTFKGKFLWNQLEIVVSVFRNVHIVFFGQICNKLL